MSDQDADMEQCGFADAPSKEEWLALLRDVSDDLARLENEASTIRARLDMIVSRIG